MRARSALTMKLLRDLWRLRAQSAAIALVLAAGVGMVVMSFGMIRSLEATRAAYYDIYRFADIFAPLRRAPESLVGRIRALPGVAQAETRTSAAAILDVPGIAEPVVATVQSLPAGAQPLLNRLVVRSGRLPAPGHVEEVVANEAFAQAARLEPGDGFQALLYGRQVSVRLVGTVLSPEHVYAVAPGQIFPDNRRYGILWMNREPLAAALNLNQSFNEVVVRLSPGAQQEEVIRRLDLLLAPYGGVGAYGRDQQISDRFVSNEIDQLATTVEILPPVFLVVAAFLLNIVLARLIDTEREVIGVMKAFGYRDRAILAHYAQLALLLSVGGLLLGFAIGTWLGRALAGLYQQFFTFPFLEFRAGADVYLIATAAALGAVLVGTAGAVRRAVALAPAEAMRPPTPPDFSGRLSKLAQRLGPDEPSRIIMRGLLRRPLRSASTVVGLALALALYIASAGANDNVERMIEIAFDRAQREDLVVTFAEPRDSRALAELARIPGVIRVEPFRAAGAVLAAGPRRVREGLLGADPDGDLARLVGIDGRPITAPVGGFVLSSRLARQLEVEPGESVTAIITEGERLRLAVPVAAVVDMPLGSSARLERRSLNRLLREGDVASGAYLSVDPERRQAVYDSLKRTPQVAGVTARETTLLSIRETVAENMGIVTLFNTGFAALIVLGIVYNSARISLSERARDLASLRVLGFRRSEVGFIMLGELAVLVLVSIGPGLLLGIGLSRYLSEQFSADLYTIPFGIEPATLADGVLVVAAAAAATALLIRGRTDKLDLVRALKTRE